MTYKVNCFVKIKIILAHLKYVLSTFGIISSIIIPEFYVYLLLGGSKCNALVKFTVDYQAARRPDVPVGMTNED